MQLSATIAAAVAAFAALTSCYGPGAGPGGGSRTAAPAAGLEVADDGTVVARGVVEENRRHCVVDGLCFLVLAVGDLRLQVIYVEAEADPCPNRAAADAGFAAEPGDRLEVHGAYRDAEGGGIVSTCPSESFYIRPGSEGF